MCCVYMVAMAISELYAKYIYIFCHREFPITVSHFGGALERRLPPPPPPPAPPSLGARSLAVDRLAQRAVSPVGKGIELRRLLLLPLSVKLW